MLNLRDRLKYVKNSKKKENVNKTENKTSLSELLIHGWKECGYKVLKREVKKKTIIKINDTLPDTIEIFIPDFAGKPLPKIKHLSFFDLETTGLSGGAGTVAFLAAFGRFIENGHILVTQYLLLDYPGENDFLQSVIKEIIKETSVIITYNGKCFDSQILKTRCLINGIRHPEYYHADILHPARRLWKNIIFDCSQASVERNILGLNRIEDIPGSDAPDIWFEFLKTGKTNRLEKICDHNAMDITGLASIFSAIAVIADDPLGQKYFKYDLHRLAFFWRFFLCRGKRYLLPQYKDSLKTCEKLLNNVVRSNCNEDIKNEAGRFLNIYRKRWASVL